MNNMPLVSIVVVSYNAEDTIVETLNSIKAQSYDPIEIIVTDDCSSDQTVAKAKEWLAENKLRFIRTVLLSSSFNQGVCANLNKGHREVRGEWIMCPAADDILFPNCLTDYMEYATTHPDVSFITAYMSWYNETFEEKNRVFRKKGPSDLTVFSLPVEKQLLTMAYSPYVWAPPIIYKRKLYEDVGGFREEYSFEDWPFYMDLLEKGYAIHFLDKITVGYRYHQSSSHSDNKLFNYNFSLKTRPFILQRCFKYYSRKKKTTVKLEWYLEDFLHRIHCDTDKPFNRFIYKKSIALLYRIGNSAINNLK